MRVLVTGATGFIGAAVVRTLSGQGHEVVAAARGQLRCGGKERLGPGPCETVVWDVSDRSHPVVTSGKIDAVVHAVQSRNFRAFPADSDEMFTVNVAGTKAVLDFALEQGVSRFCLLSSGTVYEPYGDGPLHEDVALAPTSFLGATKLAAEAVARPYAGHFALCILRLFFPFGAGQIDRLMPDIIKRVRTGVAVQLSADGEGLWFSPTLVDDIATIITRAVADAWVGPLNVASPEMTSLRKLAETIGTVVQRRPIFEINAKPPLQIRPSLQRLEKRFNLDGFTPLELAVRQAIFSNPALSDELIHLHVP